MIANLFRQCFVIHLYPLQSLENLSFKCSPGFSSPLVDPVLGPFFSGKRIRTNRQLLATQGFSDLSLLCHKGIHTLLFLYQIGQLSEDNRVFMGTLLLDIDSFSNRNLSE